MRPAQLLSSILAISALSAASSPWSDTFNLKAIRAVDDFLYPRADDSAAKTTEAAAASTAESAAQSTAQSSAKISAAESSAAATTGSDKSAAASSGSASQTGDNKSDASETGKSTAKSSGKGGSSTNKDNKTKTYGNSVGYGGISMVTPNAQSQSTFYKVGDYVTFAWNMTSLSITPSAVDILASCQRNQATYTLALNQSVSASTGAITWDTGAFQASATTPLLTETYTLIIMDAALPAVTATAAYGGLPPYNQFRFGMYLKEPDYQNISGGDAPTFECVTCKSAASSLERQTLGFLFGIVAITVATFTCFVGGAGVVF